MSWRSWFYLAALLAAKTGHKTFKGTPDRHILVFCIWLFRRWGHREIFIRSILLWNAGLIWPGGAVGLWELCSAQEAPVTLTSLSSRLSALLITGGLRIAPGPGRRYCLSHLALQLFIASKVISRDLRVPDNIASSPNWRSYLQLKYFF